MKTERGQQKVIHENYFGVCQQDTDSNYICFHEIMEELTIHEEIDDKVLLDFFLELDEDEVQPFFDRSLEWKARQIGVENKLFFKREAIAKSFISLGKKKYSLNILADEDKIYVNDDEPKIKHKGVELVQSSTPPFVKEHVKTLVLMCLDPTVSFRDMAAELFKIHKLYKKEPLSRIAKVSNLKKYDEYAYSKEFYAENGLRFKKGTPIATKAAIIHNFVINDEKLDMFEVDATSKVHWAYVEGRNKFHMDSIAWVDDFPDEFKPYFKVDYAIQFEKTVLAVVNRYSMSRGWPEIKYKQLNSFFFKF